MSDVKSRALRTGALVIYKGKPAIIRSTDGAKFEIVLPDGGSKSVRDKDVECLHAGPAVPADLQESGGDIETARELIADEVVSFEEFAGIVFGAYSPRSAWNAWRILEERLHFIRGQDDGGIRVRPASEVEALLAAKQEKEIASQAWNAHIERIRIGRPGPEDEKALRDVERLAYGESASNPTLRDLGIEQTPANAHGLLLRLRFWDETRNPYPRREGVSVRAADIPLPALPCEPIREDLRDRFAFAIDDDDSRDPDDAVGIDPDGSIWVHVADPAVLATPDSALDLDARERGTTFYAPEGIVPMLPEAAMPLFGLGLSQESPAISIKIRLDSEGNAICERISASLVRVQRVSYSNVMERLCEEPFSCMLEAARIFREKRCRAGALRLDLPEVKIKVTEGNVTIRPLPKLESREMVADLMLMAGEAVGRYAAEHGIPIPYATQPPPDSVPDSIEHLPGMYALRRQFKRTEMRLEPGTHAGLGLSCYTRVTSPLRRYSDLVVHQQIRAHLLGAPTIPADDVLKRIAQGDLNAARVTAAERSSNRHWTLVHLARNPGSEFDAVLVEKRENRGIALIPELALEARVRIGTSVKEGDALRVVIRHIDLPMLDFSAAAVASPQP